MIEVTNLKQARRIVKLWIREKLLEGGLGVILAHPVTNEWIDDIGGRLDTVMIEMAQEMDRRLGKLSSDEEYRGG